MSWRMPAETEPHECTWMAWPSSGYTLGETAADAEEARRTWAAVAHAVAEFEPVRMVVDPSALDVARGRLGADVELLEAPLDDAWMRDVGPTFVVGEEGLGAVDWVFNGWGAQGWARWENDARVARQVAEWAGATLVASDLVNEGGGIHVDGAGTVLVTRTVQLDPGRNPGWGEADVEAELRRTLGVDDVVWLERGLTRDYEEFGTRGHVDIVATMPAPGTVLVHVQPDPRHPDHVLRHRFPDGWTVRELRAPERLEDDPASIDPASIDPASIDPPPSIRPGSTTATSTTRSATAASLPAPSTTPATARPSTSSPRPTPDAAWSASTPDRCSPVVAASTASPSSSPALARFAS